VTTTSLLRLWGRPRSMWSNINANSRCHNIITKICFLLFGLQLYCSGISSRVRIWVNVNLYTSNTRLYFATELGNLVAAGRTRKIIDCRESWVRQVHQAPKQGNHEVCTHCLPCGIVLTLVYLPVALPRDILINPSFEFIVFNSNFEFIMFNVSMGVRFRDRTFALTGELSCLWILC
jgi:hypothetical protein